MKKWLCCILSVLLLFQYTATTVFAQGKSTPIKMEIDFRPDTEQVTVQGIMNGNLEDDQMTIMVLDPFGSISYIDQKDVFSDGKSSFTFKMEQGYPTGEYIVRLGGTNVNRVTEGTFSYELDGTQYSLTVNTIIDKSGELLIEGDVLTLSDKLVGTYLFSHQMKKGDLQGTYEVIVETPNGVQSEKTTFLYEGMEGGLEPETPEPETPEPETPEPETPEPETPEPETPGPETPGSEGDRGESSKPKDEKPLGNISDGKGKVTIDGEVIKTKSKDGMTEVTVEEKGVLAAIKQAAKEAKSNTTPEIIISLPIIKDANMKVAMSADIITEASTKEVNISIVSNMIQYTIPFNALDNVGLKLDETIEFSSEKLKNKEVKGKVSADKVLEVIELTLSAKSKTESRYITQFNQPIEIKINVNGLGDSNKLGIYYVNEEKESLDFVSRVVKDGFIIMKTNHYSKFAIIEKGIQFSDIANHWAKENIESIVAKGIANGYPDGTFRPNNDITRAEFVAMINSLLELESTNYKGEFKDVESSDWFANSIVTAAANGLIGGYPDGTFNPNGKITRAEMMSITSKIVTDIEISVNEIDVILSAFTDKEDIPAWAKESIAKTVKAGIIGGMDLEIKSRGQTTRAQAAAVIDRI